MINKLAILGGGTSGLVTALIVRQYYPQLEIKLIKSSNIGIVGVGEGSTEHWKKFISVVGISVPDLIRETGATFKYGIKFENWNGDNDSYFHAITNGVAIKGLNTLAGVYMKVVADNEHPYNLLDKNTILSRHHEPLEDSVNQFHFDTFKLNEYLLKICQSRNIEVIDTEIVDVNLDERGFVLSLTDKNNQQIHADFFIDGSGFQRVVSSKLGAKWKSCQKYLPMNSAIAFPTLNNNNGFPSYTISKALNAGWMWTIPTQERFGNGYVYCDRFISDDDAIKEAQTHCNEEINVARSFKFDAGYVDKFWIKNCVSIGLSGSFVEPLEASAIGTSIQQAFSFAEKILSWDRDNDYIVNLYNEEFFNVISNIIDFVQLHYITKRDDTEFWKYCKNLELTDFNKQTIEIFKKTFPTVAYFPYPTNMFRAENWILVMHGLGLFNHTAVKKLYEQQDPMFQVHTDDHIKWYDMMHNTVLTVNHKDALELLKLR